MVTTGDRVRDSIADSESFTPASQGGRLRSEGVADFRRNRRPECVGIAGRFASDYAAKDALDRITIPKDVLDRIAPTALPRSSIIVSDEPLSRETNYRTEFVAVLSNQPQGGFLMRRPTVGVPVARRRTVGAPVASYYRSNDGFGFFSQRSWSSQPAMGPRESQYYQQMQQRWW